MRKPKLKKFPKTPKSDNPDVLKRYKDRIASIQKENDAKMAEWKRFENEKNKLKDQIKKIKSKRY